MTDEKPVPALYDWSLKVWTEMQTRATMEVLEEGEDPKMIYEGHLTNLFRDLQVPNPYYTTVRKKLMQLGCLVQLRRGGGSALSKWELVKKPSEEAFKDAGELNRVPRGKVGILEQQVRDIKKMAQGLIEEFESYKSRSERIFLSLQERIVDLEEKR